MYETDYTRLLPQEPPEGLADWLKKNGKLGGDYIIYKCGTALNPDTGKNVRVVDCHCTACNKTFPAEYVKTNSGNKYAPFGFRDSRTDEVIVSTNHYLCPECGSPVTIYHISDIGAHNGGSKMAEAFPLTIHNLNGNLAMLCWNIERRIDRGGNEIIWQRPYYGYLFTKSRKLSFTGRVSGLFNMRYTEEWCPLSRFEDKIGAFSADTIYPWDVSILNGTAAENSKLDMYINCDDTAYPVSYMSLYFRFPNVENLIMSGWGKYLNYKLADTRGYYSSCPKIGNIRGLNFRKAKPAEILGLNKAEMKYIKAHKWGNERTDVYIRTKNQGVTFEKTKNLINRYGAYAILRLSGTGANIPRALRYVDKQKEKYKKEHPESNYCPIDTRYLTDYWDMAKRNGDNLSDDGIRYPHRLETAHDNAAELIQLKKAEEKNEAFVRRYKQLEKYCYKNSGLLIRPAASGAEFIEEGKKLKHCVASYADRHAAEKTAIFFIRKADKANEPYYTLEYDFDRMCIVQSRGYKNQAPPKEVKAFAEEWNEYIKDMSQKKNRLKNERSAA